ncbi:MAG: putative 2-aminoethylphosphonate ABC transporter substrate-binding protein [Saezia sp.]
MTLKKLLRALIASSTCLLIATSALAQKSQLTVYTALETEQINAYKQAFNQAHPEIELKIVRDSTGVVVSKLLAEKDNRHADVIWGVAATGLVLLDQQGMLEPYSPAHLSNLTPRYSDSKKPTHWWGLDVTGAVVCFNTVEAAKRNIPAPKTWNDLLKPEYKGQIVMPDPNSSGTGFFHIISWLQMWGDDSGKGKGWQFMDGLHNNIAQYTHSGSKPCNMAATGEYVVGISFEYRGHTNKERGAPIDLIFPTEGLGWDVEAFAILKGTPNLEAAKILADWASSQQAMALYGKSFAITAQANVAPKLANIPENYESMLIDMNFDYAAAERVRILQEWSKRYSNKSAPK